MSELSITSIQVNGPDAFEFLQNQLTNDLRRLESAPEILSAWCNPKGRVIWFGTVQTTEPGYALSVASELAKDVVRQLTVFRFRSKVEFDIVDDGATVETAFLITTGIPYVGQAQTAHFTPHMLNLDLLDAVSLDKGCFTGQEIVARTHYRGKTKRRCLRFESVEPTTPGDKVHANDRAVGEVVNAAGTDLLAIVPLDKADTSLTVNGARLVRLPLPYME